MGDVPVGSFARLVVEGLDYFRSRKKEFPNIDVLFKTPGVDGMTAMIMCLTLACAERDKADPGWLDRVVAGE